MTLPFMAFRARTAFALVALTISVGSSAMFPSPIEPAPDRGAAEPVVQEPALPPKADPPMQFDLDCDVIVRLMANPGGQRPGASSFLPYDYADHFRLVVDLQANRYCRVATCESVGRFRIPSWDRYRIVLEDDFGGGSFVSDVWIHSVVHRYEGTYEVRRTGDDGFMLRSAGRCRYLPFSGFPANSRDDSGRRN